jgi:hypothetical protein
VERIRSTRAQRVFLSAAAPLVALVLMAGCSSTASSVSGAINAISANKTKFCQDNASIDKAPAAAGAHTPSEILQVLRDNQALLDDFEKTAPSAFKAQAQTLVNNVKAAINANNPAGLAATNNLGHLADAFCGQNSEGNPIGSTSS